MKNQNRQIIMLDAQESLDKCGKILDEAERMVAFLNDHQILGSEFHLGMSAFDALCATLPAYSENFFESKESSTNTVMMLTHFDADLQNQEYSYLGGKYFVQRTIGEYNSFDPNNIILN
jgi:hypothetical protein